LFEVQEPFRPAALETDTKMEAKGDYGIFLAHLVEAMSAEPPVTPEQLRLRRAKALADSGKWYKITPPESAPRYARKIKISKLKIVERGPSPPHLDIGHGVWFEQRDLSNPCDFVRNPEGTHTSLYISELDNYAIEPVGPPEGASADWEPSFFCGGKRRKTRRRRSKRSRRTPRKI
jgi:hypothetical protein